MNVRPLVNVDSRAKHRMSIVICLIRQLHTTFIKYYLRHTVKIGLVCLTGTYQNLTNVKLLYFRKNIVALESLRGDRVLLHHSYLPMREERNAQISLYRSVSNCDYFFIDQFKNALCSVEQLISHFANFRLIRRIGTCTSHFSNVKITYCQFR